MNNVGSSQPNQHGLPRVTTQYDPNASIYDTAPVSTASHIGNSTHIQSGTHGQSPSTAGRSQSPSYDVSYILNQSPSITPDELIDSFKQTIGDVSISPDFLDQFLNSSSMTPSEAIQRSFQSTTHDDVLTLLSVRDISVLGLSQRVSSDDPNDILNQIAQSINGYRIKTGGAVVDQFAPGSVQDLSLLTMQAFVEYANRAPGLVGDAYLTDIKEHTQAVFGIDASGQAISIVVIPDRQGVLRVWDPVKGTPVGRIDQLPRLDQRAFVPLFGKTASSIIVYETTTQSTGSTVGIQDLFHLQHGQMTPQPTWSSVVNQFHLGQTNIGLFSPAPNVSLSGPPVSVMSGANFVQTSSVNGMSLVSRAESIFEDFNTLGMSNQSFKGDSFEGLIADYDQFFEIKNGFKRLSDDSFKKLKSWKDFMLSRSARYRIILSTLSNYLLNVETMVAIIMGDQPPSRSEGGLDAAMGKADIVDKYVSDVFSAIFKEINDHNKAEFEKKKAAINDDYSGCDHIMRNLVTGNQSDIDKNEELIELDQQYFEVTQHNYTQLQLAQTLSDSNQAGDGLLGEQWEKRGEQLAASLQNSMDNLLQKEDGTTYSVSDIDSSKGFRVGVHQANLADGVDPSEVGKNDMETEDYALLALMPIPALISAATRPESYDRAYFDINSEAVLTMQKNLTTYQQNYQIAMMALFRQLANTSYMVDGIMGVQTASKPNDQIASSIIQAKFDIQNRLMTVHQTLLGTLKQVFNQGVEKEIELEKLKKAQPFAIIGGIFKALGEIASYTKVLKPLALPLRLAGTAIDGLGDISAHTTTDQEVHVNTLTNSSNSKAMDEYLDLAYGASKPSGTGSSIDRFDTVNQHERDLMKTLGSSDVWIDSGEIEKLNFDEIKNIRKKLTNFQLTRRAMFAVMMTQLSIQRATISMLINRQIDDYSTRYDSILESSIQLANVAFQQLISDLQDDEKSKLFTFEYQQKLRNLWTDLAINLASEAASSYLGNKLGGKLGKKLGFGDKLTTGLKNALRAALREGFSSSASLLKNTFDPYSDLNVELPTVDKKKVSPAQAFHNELVKGPDDHFARLDQQEDVILNDMLDLGLDDLDNPDSAGSLQSIGKLGFGLHKVGLNNKRLHQLMDQLQEIQKTRQLIAAVMHAMLVRTVEMTQGIAGVGQVGYIGQKLEQTAAIKNGLSMALFNDVTSYLSRIVDVYNKQQDVKFDNYMQAVDIGFSVASIALAVVSPLWASALQMTYSTIKAIYKAAIFGARQQSDYGQTGGYDVDSKDEDGIFQAKTDYTPREKEIFDSLNESRISYGAGGYAALNQANLVNSMRNLEVHYTNMRLMAKMRSFLLKLTIRMSAKIGGLRILGQLSVHDDMYRLREQARTQQLQLKFDNLQQYVQRHNDIINYRQKMIVQILSAVTTALSGARNYQQYVRNAGQVARQSTNRLNQFLNAAWNSYHNPEFQIMFKKALQLVAFGITDSLYGNQSAPVVLRVKESRSDGLGGALGNLNLNSVRHQVKSAQAQFNMQLIDFRVRLNRLIADYLVEFLSDRDLFYKVTVPVLKTAFLHGVSIPGSLTNRVGLSPHRLTHQVFGTGAESIQLRQNSVAKAVNTLWDRIRRNPDGKVDTQVSKLNSRLATATTWFDTQLAKTKLTVYNQVAQKIKTYSDGTPTSADIVQNASESLNEAMVNDADQLSNVIKDPSLRRHIETIKDSSKPLVDREKALKSLKEDSKKPLVDREKALKSLKDGKPTSGLSRAQSKQVSKDIKQIQSNLSKLSKDIKQIQSNLSKLSVVEAFKNFNQTYQVVSSDTLDKADSDKLIQLAKKVNAQDGAKSRLFTNRIQTLEAANNAQQTVSSLPETLNRQKDLIQSTIPKDSVTALKKGSLMSDLSTIYHAVNHHKSLETGLTQLITNTLKSKAQALSDRRGEFNHNHKLIAVSVLTTVRAAASNGMVPQLASQMVNHSRQSNNATKEIADMLNLAMGYLNKQNHESKGLRSPSLKESQMALKALIAELGKTAAITRGDASLVQSLRQAMSASPLVSNADMIMPLLTHQLVRPMLPMDQAKRLVLTLTGSESLTDLLKRQAPPHGPLDRLTQQIKQTVLKALKPELVDSIQNDSQVNDAKNKAATDLVTMLTSPLTNKSQQPLMNALLQNPTLTEAHRGTLNRLLQDAGTLSNAQLSELKGILEAHVNSRSISSWLNELTQQFKGPDLSVVKDIQATLDSHIQMVTNTILAPLQLAMQSADPINALATTVGASPQDVNATIQRAVQAVLIAESQSVLGSVISLNPLMTTVFDSMTTAFESIPSSTTLSVSAIHNRLIHIKTTSGSNPMEAIELLDEVMKDVREDEVVANRLTDAIKSQFPTFTNTQSLLTLQVFDKAEYDALVTRLAENGLITDSRKQSLLDQSTSDVSCNQVRELLQQVGQDNPSFQLTQPLLDQLYGRDPVTSLQEAMDSLTTLAGAGGMVKDPLNPVMNVLRRHVNQANQLREGAQVLAHRLRAQSSADNDDFAGIIADDIIDSIDPHELTAAPGPAPINSPSGLAPGHSPSAPQSSAPNQALLMQMQRLLSQLSAADDGLTIEVNTPTDQETDSTLPIESQSRLQGQAKPSTKPTVTAQASAGAITGAALDDDDDDDGDQLDFKHGDGSSVDNSLSGSRTKPARSTRSSSHLSENSDLYSDAKLDSDSHSSDSTLTRSVFGSADDDWALRYLIGIPQSSQLNPIARRQIMPSIMATNSDPDMTQINQTVQLDWQTRSHQSIHNWALTNTLGALNSSNVLKHRAFIKSMTGPRLVQYYSELMKQVSPNENEKFAIKTLLTELKPQLHPDIQAQLDACDWMDQTASVTALVNGQAIQTIVSSTLEDNKKSLSEKYAFIQQVIAQMAQSPRPAKNRKQQLDHWMDRFRSSDKVSGVRWHKTDAETSLKSVLTQLRGKAREQALTAVLMHEPEQLAKLALELGLNDITDDIVQGLRSVTSTQATGQTDYRHIYMIQRVLNEMNRWSGLITTNTITKRLIERMFVTTSPLIDDLVDYVFDPNIIAQTPDEPINSPQDMNELEQRMRALMQMLIAVDIPMPYNPLAKSWLDQRLPSVFQPKGSQWADALLGKLAVKLKANYTNASLTEKDACIKKSAMLLSMMYRHRHYLMKKSSPWLDVPPVYQWDRLLIEKLKALPRDKTDSFIDDLEAAYNAIKPGQQPGYQMDVAQSQSQLIEIDDVNAPLFGEGLGEVDLND